MNNINISTVSSIKNRLSLRSPQADCLEILADLVDGLSLGKNPDLGQEVEFVRQKHPTFSDFERNFPSLCFSLATGVGKTRLMGAFITYLYQVKGIRNFFVLAPNLTIYNKLIEDFSDGSSSKYVFRGIGEFVHSPPRIITGDNYNQARIQLSAFDSININIFNISKINQKSTDKKALKIKSLSEYIGESYFEYLSNLEDLVLLMDESHHYRADRGLKVLNELNPILGLEVTATPQIEDGRNTIRFKNVVYEYSLAKAIRDGFVKEPAVATRRDFNPEHYRNNPDELFLIKLKDGIRLHEDTKVELDIYARDNGVKLVKPFVLVVAKDTQHASRLKEIIQSTEFFNGYYADKVITVSSAQRGEEKEETIQQLLDLENPLNKTEIVIHVYMLKEGWDVTNLYTIIPLSAAASMTLREQTIGRGLRLPYGKRTGNNKVDRLTIVAHDKFQEIIDAANRPDSIIRKENIIEIEEQEISQKKEIVISKSIIENGFEEEVKRIESLPQTEERHKAQIELAAKKVLLDTLPELRKESKSLKELKRSEMKVIAETKIRDRLINEPQQLQLPIDEIVSAAMNNYVDIIDELTQKIIEIPRIFLTQVEEVQSGFHDFDLDTKPLNFHPVSEELIIESLQSGEQEFLTINGRLSSDTLENILVNEIIDAPQVDYDSQSDLLFKLARQAIEKFSTYLSEEGLTNVVQYYKRQIALIIYSQMQAHFYSEAPRYVEPDIFPFTRIEDHNLSKSIQDNLYHFRETINPTNAIPSKIFHGFEKSCHRLYKFHSKTEKDFAILLENDQNVLKWLRPAPRQFHIYWDHNSKQYHPDFVMETSNAIYLVETKKMNEVATAEVQEKAQAALQYCHHASKYTSLYGGKPWKYVLIPHNAVLANMSTEFLFQNYLYEGNLNT